MALVKGSIPNMVGGVSQQSPTLRLPGQSTDDLNTFPVLVEGLTRRPPTEHIAVLSGSQVPATAFIHEINRDEAERYAVSIAGGVIKIVDLAGNEKTVTTPDGVGYLSVPAGTENVNLTAVTIADYTFIVNKTVIAAMSSETAPTRLPEALVNVIEGVYGKTFSVSVNGTAVATYTLPDGSVAAHSTAIDTTAIASTLKGQMVNPSGGDLTTANGWNVAQASNYVWVQRLTGVDFTIASSDGWTNHAMKTIKNKTQQFTDLPPMAPEGFVAAVVGDTSSPDQLYYVQFVADTVDGLPPPSGWGGFLGYSQAPRGNWVECPKPGVLISFDAATMPHILVRNVDGTFTFKRAVWDKRVAGDETTIPKPSFIGQKINDIVFHKNRLGVLANGSSVWSRAGDYFNFWRTSALTLLDDDPIDINAATAQVAVLRTGIAYQTSLILWSDQNQFSFGGNELVTPKTANMPAVSNLENLSKYCRPVSTTHRLLYPFDRDGYVGVKEWYFDKDYHTITPEEVTAHVPTFIPAGVYKLVNSGTEDTAVAATSGDRSALWVYKYLWHEASKIQSAWVKWTFPGATILSHFFINSTLYLYLNRGSVTTLEKMRLTPGLTDGGLPVTYLDRRVGSDALAAPTYDINTDTTSYTLPYAPPTDGSLTAVTRPNASAPQFMEKIVASVSGTTVKLGGDTRDLLLWFGVPFTSRHVYSPIYVRDPAKDQVVQEGKLQLLKLDLSYQASGYFRVEVTPGGRGPSKYEFFGWHIGDALPDVDADPSLRSGVFTIPVLSNNENVDIRIVNDSFLPSRFTRTEWKGNFVPKARK